MMWGAKVKTPVDMPDDMLQDAIQTVKTALEGCTDFEADGMAVAGAVKQHFDKTWTPNWHVTIGRNFGSFVTHETRGFLYFYIGDKAVMLFKAG